MQKDKGVLVPASALSELLGLNWYGGRSGSIFGTSKPTRAIRQVTESQERRVDMKKTWSLPSGRGSLCALLLLVPRCANHGMTRAGHGMKALRPSWRFSTQVRWASRRPSLAQKGGHGPSQLRQCERPAARSPRSEAAHHQWTGQDQQMVGTGDHLRPALGAGSLPCQTHQLTCGSRARPVAAGRMTWMISIRAPFASRLSQVSSDSPMRVFIVAQTTLFIFARRASLAGKPLRGRARADAMACDAQQARGFHVHHPCYARIDFSKLTTPAIRMDR